MSSFMELLMQYFRQYNILFLSVLMILQGIGVPIGMSMLVIACGAFAYAGEFNIISILLEVWIFAWLGDCAGYFLWRIIGYRVLNKFPKINNYFEPKILKAHNYLDKHGKLAVFLTRFLISPMGPFVNASAGIVNYSLVEFSLFALLGELFWTIIYIALGYWFGDSWENIIPLVSQFGQIITYVVILMIIVYMFIKIIRGKNKK
ncbi:DedA family protein [Clostridium neuense]|uniref:DedA family protein n=1 Tax=Clostridium neuense TaxID=1728934 RepID=A0ABW8TJF3_9CLOT